jgi:tRNA-specific 2-thiouridylase
MKKALIAMSGGVDSSVAAALMLERGYECIGVTMKLYDNDEIGISREKTCCSLDDIEDARSVARKLGFPYYVFNFREDFQEKVIDKFVDSYMHGITPNPCIDCNRYLKFEQLYMRAVELGCDTIVTGHYARIRYNEANKRYVLMKGTDPEKDQSYVLYSLTQEQLAHTVFPLGELDKSEVRKIAESKGLLNAHKHDSQDICFVPDGDYKHFIEKYTGRTCPEGNFVDEDGNVLGHHNGICNYTIGQRKGLGIAFGHPVFVSEIRPDTNEVVLSGNESLLGRECTAGDFNWIAYDKPADAVRVAGKIRYRAKEAAGTAVCDGDKVHMTFDVPQRAITYGQALVLYDGDNVVGGGTICGKGRGET